MSSPRTTRSSAVASLSPVSHKKDLSFQTEGPTPRNNRHTPRKSKTSPSKALSAANGSLEGAAEGDDEYLSSDADEEGDGLAPLTSPLAARAARSVTPLTSENLARAQAAHSGEDWAGSKKSAMFAEDESAGGTSDDSDIDVADDDDDYDGVDNVSAASDTPSNESRLFEAEIEREILDAGENAIDWDNDNTYRYDAAFSDHQFSMYALEGDELGIGPDIFGAATRQASTPQPVGESQPLQETFLKGTPLDPAENAWPSSSSTSGSDDEPAANDDADDGSDALDSSGQEGGSDDDAVDQDIESLEDDSTDDEGPILEHIKTPSVTLTNHKQPKSAPQLTNARKTTSAIETPENKKIGKFGKMRRFKLDPTKAVAYARSSPNGRILCFTQPRNGRLRWVSTRTSRSSSIDSSAEIQDPVLRAQVIDACRSVLFRRHNCNTNASSPIVNKLSSPFARTSMLSSPFASHRGANGIDETIASSIEEDAENLIDFDGGHSQYDDEPSEHRVTVKQESSMPPPPLTNGRAPRTPESATFPAPPVTKLETPSPKKRRNDQLADDERHSSLTPAMKKQRVDV